MAFVRCNNPVVADAALSAAVLDANHA